MSVSTPSKERRAERHLMRIRGAGKIARELSQDLFAFKIDVHPVIDPHIPPLKRQKLNACNHGVFTISQEPAAMIVDTVTPKQTTSKDRARKAAQKLFDEPQPIVVRKVKSPPQLDSTRPKSVNEARPGETKSTKSSEFKERDAKARGSTSCAATTSASAYEKSNTTPARDAPCQATRSEGTPFAVLLQSSVQLTSKKQSSAGHNGRATTKRRTQQPSKRVMVVAEPQSETNAEVIDRKAAEENMRPLSKTSREDVAPDTIPDELGPLPSVQLRSRPHRQNQSHGHVPDGLQSLPSATPTQQRAHLVAPTRHVLGNISPNRGDAPSADKRSKHKSADSGLKRREKTQDMNKPTTRPLASQSRPDSSKKTSRSTQTPEARSTGENRGHNESAFFCSIVPPTVRPRVSRKRSRAAAAADDDVDLDDLIMNITTLTKGIEHHLPKHKLAGNA